MGYTNYLKGRVDIVPPLNTAEIDYLRKLAASSLAPDDGQPYQLEGKPAEVTFPKGTRFRSSVSDRHAHTVRQPPGGYLGWEIDEDGVALFWDGGEKFNRPAEWMAWLVTVFLSPKSPLRRELRRPVRGRSYPEQLAAFTFDHHVTGHIVVQGERPWDRWHLVVRDNKVRTKGCDCHCVAMPVVVLESDER